MKFECKKCGTCCRRFSNEDRSLRGLPLFEWEKEQLEKIANENGIKLNIKVLDLLFDKRSRVYICINFNLDQEPCPFLVENKCSIYETRPLACRVFPILENPLIKEGAFNLSCFLHCQNFDFKNFLLKSFGFEEGKSYKIKKTKAIKEFLDVFGEEIFVYSLIQNMMKEYVDGVMKFLIENNKVKLRKVSKFDFNKCTPTPFFEFLRKIGMCDERGKEHLIKEMGDYNKAKNLLMSQLKNDDK